MLNFCYGFLAGWVAIGAVLIIGDLCSFYKSGIAIGRGWASIISIFPWFLALLLAKFAMFLKKGFSRNNRRKNGDI